MDFDENHCDTCDSPIDDHRCKGCESGISFRDHLDDTDCTGYCDGCAQNRMLELEAKNAELTAEVTKLRTAFRDGFRIDATDERFLPGGIKVHDEAFLTAPIGLLKSMEYLSAENQKLRAALDAAADAFQEIATKRKEGVQNLILRNENYAAASFAGETATFAIEATRACWAALGKDWGQGT